MFFFIHTVKLFEQWLQDQLACRPRCNRIISHKHILSGLFSYAFIPPQRLKLMAAPAGRRRSSPSHPPPGLSDAERQQFLTGLLKTLGLSGN
jgi:hypothetical protein